MENNEVKRGILEHDGITVLALRPLDAKSLSSQIMPQFHHLNRLSREAETNCKVHENKYGCVQSEIIPRI